MTQETNRKREPTSERKPSTYHNFNLRFGNYRQANGTFEVWVEGDTMRPDSAAQCIYNPTAFLDDPILNRGGLLDGLERRKLNRETMYKLGKMLADLALPEGQVRNLFLQNLAALEEGEGLRIRLHIDPIELVQLPWEFVALPQAPGEPKPSDFLALRREISIVRTDTVESVTRPLPNRDKARVVAILSSPRDQSNLDVDDDKQAIEQAVKALNQAAGQELIQVTWVENPATWDFMEQALSEGADIFHFAGHAVFDTLASKEGQIILEKGDRTSDYYSGEKLALLLRNSEVRLAVLGACETGRRDGRNVWSGIAPALTRERIPAVIANQFKIKDDNAILLAEKVYHLVLAGYTVDEALFEARQAVYQYKGLENRDWGTPVLYLHDQNGVLFPRTEADPTVGSPASPFVHITNTFKEVSGQVVDVEIRKVTRGRIQISDTIDVVKESGTFTSLKIDELG